MKAKRMGRPPLAKNERKAAHLSVRFTEEELRSLEQAARRSGIDVSEWARRNLLKDARTPPEVMRKATSLEQGGMTQEEIAQEIGDIQQSYVAKLLKIDKKICDGVKTLWADSWRRSTGKPVTVEAMLHIAGLRLDDESKQIREYDLARQKAELSRHQHRERLGLPRSHRAP